MTTSMSDLSAEELRTRAVAQLKKQRDFRAHLLVFVLVNGFLTTVWLLTDDHGFFWPVFPMALWGIGVVMNAWDAFHADGFSEQRIEREVRRLGDRG